MYVKVYKIAHRYLEWLFFRLFQNTPTFEKLDTPLTIPNQEVRGMKGSSEGQRGKSYERERRAVLISWFLFLERETVLLPHHGPKKDLFILFFYKLKGGGGGEDRP